MRILHLSDPHFGACDTRVASAFLDRARELAPDLTILSGDLTMRVRRRELAQAAAFVSELPAPRLVIPGNHDIPALNHPFDRFFRPFHRYRRTFGDDLEPSLRIDGTQVIALNSSRAFGFHADWSLGFISPLQLHHLSSTADSEATLRILVLHHPLLKTGEKGRETVMPITPLNQTLREARIDLVLCGHFHRSHIDLNTDAPGSVVSQAPTVCSTRLQGEPQGFHLIQADGDQLSVQLHRFSESHFKPVSSSRFIRTPDGWMRCE